MTFHPERTAALSCVAAAVLYLSGCAASAPRSNVRVDQAESGPPTCQTFDWLPASKDAVSLTEQRVRAAAIEQLQAKGYAHSTEKPDCRITYVLDMRERPKPKPNVGVGAGGGSGGIGGGIGVSLPIGRKSEQVGTFTLDVIDAAKNAQVWSGSFEASFDATELNEDEARSAVKKVLARFPGRAGAN
jgi:hypothetical protein